MPRTPLAMRSILVPEPALRKGGELHVVLRIRRRQYYRLRPGVFEQDPFESREPGRVQVLNNLQDSRGVKTVEALVPIHQRAVD